MGARTGRVYAALIVSTLLWGSMSPAAKSLVGVIGPAQVAFVRGLSAFVVLSIFCWLVAGPRPLRAALAQPFDVLILGLLGYVGSSVSGQLALQYIPASLHVVLISTSPVILAVGALFQRSISARAASGAVIALIGVAAVIGGDDPAQVLRGGLDPRGLALSFVNALMIAGSQIWGRRVARLGEPIGTTAVAAGMSLPFLLVPSLFQGGLGEIVAAPLEAKLVLLYLGVICTAMTFGLWFGALKYITAARAAPYQYLSPPTGILLAWWLLGEPLTLGLAVGTGLILIGVALTQTGRRAAAGGPARPVPSAATADAG